MFGTVRWLSASSLSPGAFSASLQAEGVAFGRLPAECLKKLPPLLKASQGPGPERQSGGRTSERRQNVRAAAERLD